MKYFICNVAGFLTLFMYGCTDKPTGPFVEISDGPVFDPGYPIIDAMEVTSKGELVVHGSTTTPQFLK